MPFNSCLVPAQGAVEGVVPRKRAVAHHFARLRGMNVSAAARSDCYMAAACVYVARLSLGNRARPLGGCDLIPRRTANPNARRTRPATRRQARAVEARAPCRAAPHVGHTELALRSGHDRAAIIVRAAARRGTAARRRAASRRRAATIARCATARSAIVRAAVAGCRAIGGAAITRGAARSGSSFGLGGSRSSSLFRRLLSRSLFFGKQFSYLGIE